MAHNSSRRCQSWFDRASREASREKIAPTWLIATSLTRVLKSSRLVVRAPDWPRSRSRIRIRSELQPRDCALLARLYWRSVLSWLKRTCPIDVEGSDGRVHLVEALAAAQKFGIDRADLIEHLAQFAEVGEELADFGMGCIRHIADPRALAGSTDRGKISLGAVPRPIDTVAVGPAAAL